MRMKARELIEKLCSWSGPIPNPDRTCDTVKCGDPEKELRKVATAMFATPEVIRGVRQWGGDLLIVHEPTFYSHLDEHLENDPVTAAKEKLLRESGLTVYRFHDHAHSRKPDLIGEGELKRLGLKGRFIQGPHWAVNRFVADAPVTPLELAEMIEARLHIEHVRICGARDVKCSKLSLCFGTPGGVFEELRRDDIEIVLTGEACEWSLGEYARDAGQFGFSKALLILGHCGSERDGMRLLADLLSEQYRDFETRYFECGEVYSYTR